MRIHQHPNWPSFTWDAEVLTPKLADIRHRQGQLLGRMEGLGFELTQEVSLNMLTTDVVQSSAIEGITLAPKTVRTSIARRLGINIPEVREIASSDHQDIEGFADMVLDATQQYLMPLTKARLFKWHRAVFPTGMSGMYPIMTGGWRTAGVQVVSGAIGHEKVHFDAPDAERLDVEMTVFLDWFNQPNDIDPLLKAAIAHVWFEIIHPFEDGNGRLGRAICDMALCRADGASQRFYSLSKQFKSERKAYYHQLERVGKNSHIDITPWLSWFLSCLERAILRSEHTLENVFFKARLWDSLKHNPVNERQRHILNRMLEENFQGFMNKGKYAKIAKCAETEAISDITDLLSRGIFIQNQGGRHPSYQLIKDINTLAHNMEISSTETARKYPSPGM